MRLEGKVAIVTGAATGIGRAIAERYVAEGAKVLISDIEGDAVEKTAQEISGSGGECSSCICDVTRAEDVDSMVATAVKRHGGLDIAVCNAGIGLAAPFLELSPEQFDRVMAINVRGVFLTAQAAARRFVEAGTEGIIVALGSIAGVRSIPDQVAYCTSKAAVNHMAATMAVALAPHGIRVNAIGPGSVNTELMRNMVMTSEEGRRTVLSRTPMGRPAEPEEIASVAVFLASEDSSYVTGSTLFVDGGRGPLMYTVPVLD